MAGCERLFTHKGSVWDCGKEKSTSLSLIMKEDGLPQQLLTAMNQPEK